MAADRIPEGFQQTEVGVIPGDWEVKSIGQICKIHVGRDLKEDFFSKTKDSVFKYPVFSNTVSTYGLYGYYSQPEYQGDSLTVVGRGVGLGSAFCRTGGFGAIGRLLVLFPDENTNARYLTEYINQYISIFSESSGVPQLTGVSFAKYKIPLPPTLAEQTAIATALSDMDALIESLERLIGKKRAVKQGAMQALLRPKEPWVEKPLKMLTNYIASGKSDTNPTKGTYPIYGSTGIIGSSLDYDYSGRKILIARVGANAGKVNKVDGNYCVSDNTLIVDITDKVDLDFIYHYLINLDLNKIIFGSGQPLITGGQLKELLIFLPPNKTEQTAIARALSDMDAEIEQLEAQLTKYRRVKEGMMQELLTGKKRLV